MNETIVIISTHNANLEYFKIQLRSILSQSVPVDVLIRDDGSTDLTFLSFLRSIERLNNIQIVYGKNIGVILSFFSLLKLCGDTYKYIVFADQDDVFLKNKIRNAIEIISQHDETTPFLYISRIRYINANANVIGDGKIRDTTRLNIRNALVENLATGNSSIINNALRNIVIEYNPKEALMHDWWIYLVATAFGKIYYDNRISVLYRQHAHNVLGGSPSYWRLICRRVKQFWNHSNNYKVINQAQCFLHLYSDRLPPDKYALIISFIQSKTTLLSRIKYLLSKRNIVQRYDRIDNFILSVVILLGRY